MKETQTIDTNVVADNTKNTETVSQTENNISNLSTDENKNPNKNPLVLIIRTRGISRVTTLIRMLFTQPASASAATLQCV